MTENGWPQVGPDQLDRTPVPGTNGKLVIPLQRGDAATIMRAFAADINEFVESLNNSRGYADEGGWTPTNSVPTSNHLGGTAMDLNWEDHPLHVKNGGWDGSDIIPGDQVPEVRRILAFYEGMIFWGNDWDSPVDSMHFQMGYNTAGNGNAAKRADFIKRKIRPDGFSRYRRDGGSTLPAPPVFTAEFKQDWIFNELHKPFGSRSPYRADDNAFDTLAGRLLDLERQVNMQLVERACERGEKWAVDVVTRIANGDEKAAGTWLWYPVDGKKAKDQWAIDHAKAVLSRLGSTAKSTKKKAT